MILEKLFLMWFLLSPIIRKNSYFCVKPIIHDIILAQQGKQNEKQEPIRSNSETLRELIRSVQKADNRFGNMTGLHTCYLRPKSVGIRVKRRT